MKAAAFFAAVFFLFEAALRLAEPFFPSSYVNDPLIGLRVKPGALGSNRLGFNDQEFSEEKAPGVFRVAALGDSFSWQGGVEGNYWSLAEKELNRLQPGLRAEILNFGVLGTGPSDYERMLRHLSFRYSPDLVVVGIYAGNDFFEAGPNYRLEVRFGTWFSPSSEKSFFLNLDRVSYLIFFLKSRFTIWKNEYDRRREEGREASSGALSKDNFLKREKHKIRAFDPGFYEGLEWISVQRRLLEMRDFTKEKKIPLAVIILPEEFQVNEALWEELFRRFPDLDRSAYDRQLPQKMLIRFLRQEKIPFFNGLEAFNAEPTGEPLYHPFDTHFNMRGNEVTARGVSRFLGEQIQMLKKETALS